MCSPTARLLARARTQARNWRSSGTLLTRLWTKSTTSPIECLELLLRRYLIQLRSFLLAQFCATASTTEPNETERRVDAETARRRGLKTAEERAAARSLAWRRAVVRFASCCALAAVAHERRDALEPLTSRLRRAAIAANRARTRRVGRGKEAKREASEASRDDAAEEVAFRRLGADAAADAEGEGVASIATRASAEA